MSATRPGSICVAVFSLAGCGGTQDDPTVSLPRVDKPCLLTARQNGAVGAQAQAPLVQQKRSDPVVVAPNAIAGKRTFGRILIMPDEDTQDAIRIEAIPRICPTFKLCLDEQGVPQEITVHRSSCFLRYEAQIMETMRDWRYSPYMIDGAGVKVCTAITMCYAQRPRP